jgi:hypothetical protein
MDRRPYQPTPDIPPVGEIRSKSALALAHEALHAKQFVRGDPPETDTRETGDP